MADVLSQSEVESLLAALDPRDNLEQSAAGRGSGAGGVSQPVNVYDFKRPERVSKEQIRVVQALHEGFSREFGAGLSGMLRTIVEVKLIGVDQLTYGEFVFSLENPTCFNLIESKGLSGHIILDLTPSIIFPIVDRLLGGGKHFRSTYPKRALTDIELKLVSRITHLALSGLDKAWANICELGLTVTQIESNPQLIQIVPPNEVVVLVSFELIMGDMQGVMNLCIPYNTIEPFSGRLSSDTWSSYTKRTPEPGQRINLETGVAHAPVEMVVLLAETKLTAREIRDLDVGDVLLTEHQTKRGLKVLIEDEPLFEGFAGAYRGHKAVRVSKRLPRAKELINRRLDELAAGQENR
jgi:flagellar motor switch protein FliM